MISGIRLFFLLALVEMTSLAGADALQLPYACEMSVIVPVSNKGFSVSLPIVNDYPHGYAIEKNLRIQLSCDGENFVCEYEIPYRKGYKFRATQKHDGSLWREDSVEIFIKRADTKKEYCQYIVNPVGTVFDKNSVKGTKWNSKLRVETDIKNNVWRLKAFIPLSDIGLKRIDGDVEIGFNTAVRSVDAKNRYVLGLFPFFPKQFAQPKNFGRVILSSRRLFVSEFRRKWELKEGVTNVIPKIGLGNVSNRAESIVLNNRRYSIKPFSTIYVNLQPQKIVGLRGIVGLHNVAGMNYVINMSNPFAPQITFARSGKDKILIECVNTRELAGVYDRVKITFDGLDTVEFPPGGLDGAEFSCVGLKPGRCSVVIESVKDGKTISRVVTDVFVIDEKPINFDLSRLDVSKYYKPMRVALPVIRAARSEIKLAPSSAFPESIKVDGEEILNGAIYFRINKISRQSNKVIRVVNQHKNRISFESSFKVGSAKVYQKSFVDYDGLIWFDNRIELQKGWKGRKIYAIVPMKLKGDIFINYSKLFRNWQLTREGVRTEGTFNKKYLAWSKKLEDGQTVVLPLTAMISIVNDFRGLAIYPPVDPSELNIENYDRYIEVSRNGENVDVKITLSDGKGALANRNFEFTFGVQAIPSRVYDGRANFDFRVYKGSRAGRDLLYAQQKIDATINTGKTWIIPFQCWTEYQNYFTTYKYSAQMHKLIEMLHSKRKRVSPYFGFEISDVCPEAKLYLKTVSTGEGGGYIRENYAQVCWPVCYASQWGDYWLRGIKKFLSEYKIDGMYMDGTLGIHACMNVLHGHGRDDSRGRWVPYFPILEIRRFSQILHAFTRTYKSDFMLYLHNSHPFVPATMGFVDVILNGEQTKPILGTWKIPLDVYRAEFNGRQFGVPTQILSYSARRTYRREYAGSLLFDEIITPWTVSRSQEVLFTEKIWRVFDKYKLEGKYFVPFYSSQARVKDVRGNALVSYYDTPRYLAIVISNYEGTKPIEAVIDVSDFAGKLKAISREIFDGFDVPISSDTFRISVGKENFKFVVIEKRNR